MPTQPIRIFIADDHDILVDSLVALLSGQDSQKLEPVNVDQQNPIQRDAGISFVGRANTPQQLLERLRQMHHNVDILLLDIQFSRDNFEGVDLIPTIVKDFSKVKIIMLSQFEDMEIVGQCLKNGAKGYISKESGRKFLLEGITKVFKGELYTKVVHPYNVPEENSGGQIILLDLELKILERFLAEWTAAEISFDLGMGTPNVERVLRIMRGKFGVRSAVGLSREVIERNLAPCWKKHLEKQ